MYLTSRQGAYFRYFCHDKQSVGAEIISKYNSVRLERNRHEVETDKTTNTVVRRRDGKLRESAACTEHACILPILMQKQRQSE